MTTRSKGTRSKGTRSKGTRSKGTRSKGTRSKGGGKEQTPSLYDNIATAMNNLYKTEFSDMSNENGENIYSKKTITAGDVRIYANFLNIRIKNVEIEKMPHNKMVHSLKRWVAYCAMHPDKYISNKKQNEKWSPIVEKHYRMVFNNYLTGEYDWDTITPADAFARIFSIKFVKRIPSGLVDLDLFSTFSEV
jgi:hypothetical protein